jgi:hypothetical protein
MSERSNPDAGLGEQDDQAAQDEAMRQLREELATAPAGDVVAQAAAHLATFAYVRLGIPPEQHQSFRDLDAARVLIDALGGMVGAVRGRLGQGEEQLHEAVASLRMSFAQASGGRPPGPASDPGATRRPDPARPAQEEPRPQRPSGLWVPGQD